MVLTGPQTTAFFTEDSQMGIPQATYDHMKNSEGINTVDDLADFDKDTLKQLAENLRKPGGGVNGGNPFVFGAKSQRRLAVSCELVRYYNEVGRTLTTANIQWTHVGKNFEIQWKALQDKKKEDESPDVPKITKALPIMKWTEAFYDYLSRVIGKRTIPLAYVTREKSEVPAAIPTLAQDQPHSTEHGSVEEELIARAKHDHPLYRDDNAEVYYAIDEAT